VATKTSARPRKSVKKAAKRAARSLHIGLNAVDPKHYEGWSGPLAACELDARDMDAIAKSRGMTRTLLLTKNATRAKTLAAIRAAAKALKSGDLFFLSYSGHGGQIDDVSGEEEDKLDETWCLFDGQLIDDELYFELSTFKKGVRVVVLSDSCHSGTVTRARIDPKASQKLMPPAKAREVYLKHKAFYDGIQKSVMTAASKAQTADPDAALAQVAVSGRLTDVAARMKAAVILISGCQDNQTSMDGERNGAFTEQLLKVWDNGMYRGNYARFHAAIKSELPASQSPNLFSLGPAAKFAREQPFSV
jgi:metacaspase-1